MKYIISLMSVGLMVVCSEIGAGDRGEIGYVTKEGSLLNEKTKLPVQKILYSLEYIQKRCPVLIGNKRFTSDDLLAMTDEQKEWFLDHDDTNTLCHMCCCKTGNVFSTADIAFLKKIPREYTKGLQVRTPKYEYRCVTASCWLGAILLLGFCTSGVVACTCGQACTKATLVGRYAMHSMTGFGSATILTPLCAIGGEWCCNKHCNRIYNFDEECEEE